MAKGTSRAEVTSNSEKIKPVALAIVELFIYLLLLSRQHSWYAQEKKYNYKDKFGYVITKLRCI